MDDVLVAVVVPSYLRAVLSATARVSSIDGAVRRLLGGRLSHGELLLTLQSSELAAVLLQRENCGVGLFSLISQKAEAAQASLSEREREAALTSAAPRAAELRLSITHSDPLLSLSARPSLQVAHTPSIHSDPEP
ncbi:hypothetical protein EYF80_044804 [Liparis tanakae]|uniref:Uncharacterized protein n=1 Tax=Liparis tanakae TaxID=230148 RepID=A0A4Z2FV00_9TELE|nr:hypothetical protein EYF80_044804 [Liparis tanakae]